MDLFFISRHEMPDSFPKETIVRVYKHYLDYVFFPLLLLNRVICKLYPTFILKSLCESAKRKAFFNWLTKICSSYIKNCH